MNQQKTDIGLANFLNFGKHENAHTLQQGMPWTNWKMTVTSNLKVKEETLPFTEFHTDQYI